MSFDYTSGPIEVFIVSNDEQGVTNGYAEVSAVAQLLSPFHRMSTTQIWNNTHSSYKIQHNGKNFIHAIAICKYLSTIPECDSLNYKGLRQLARDLFVGDQNSEQENKILADLQQIKNLLEDMVGQLNDKNNNILTDFNSLLRVLKTEIINELIDGVVETVPNVDLINAVDSSKVFNNTQ